MDKISPKAFFPPPKVYSRLMYFKPRFHEVQIPQEEEFWRFIKFCFRQPRRTLRNNLVQTQIDLAKIPEKYLTLRAQQMKFEDLLELWLLLI
jgi:16S rRNA A1518/A1519 N6-dimethyltransferase RsmA/KsgA/DIM1 with predicted DNA glycosylase/AP lyase activity